MRYFTFKEMILSDTAKVRNIDNTPDWDSINNLRQLVECVLEPIRELYGAPITVNSGYRSKALNQAVNGVSTSHHLNGYAADITVGSISKNKVLFDLIINSNLKWTQAILEEGGKWIHISYIADNLKNLIIYT